MTSYSQNAVLAVSDRCGETPLLGRADELALLQRHLEQTASGCSRVIVIEGEAGIGKSRLLAEALEHGRSLGFTILRGTAEEIAVSRPFGVLADVLRRGRSSIEGDRVALDQVLAADDTPGPKVASERRVGPVVPRVSSAEGSGFSRPPEQSWEFLETALDVLEQLATSAPIVLALEDLHWADPSSLRTIRAVANYLATLPILVVGTLRPVPRVPELDRLVDDLVASGATRLVLRPLDEAAVRELVKLVVGAPPGPVLVADAAGAAGNPLFVLEWLRALVQAAEVEVTSGQAELTFRHREGRDLDLRRLSGPSAPPAFARSVLRRLHYLSGETLEALQVAAVLGLTFSLADLSLVIGSPASALLGRISEALAAGLLEDAEGQLRFRHALIHQAIYTDLPSGVRAAMHQQVGQVLAGVGAPSGQIAHHLARGAGPGDAEAVAWLQRAAVEAAAGSPGVGADLLARALELASPSDPLRPRLLAQRAMALIWSGGVDEGEEVARQALVRRLEPAVEGDLRLGLGRALLLQGRASEAITHFDAGAHLAGVSEHQQAQLRADASLGRVVIGDIPGAVAEAEKAVAVGESAGDDHAICAAWGTLSMATILQGDPSSAVAYATRAVARADASPSVEAQPPHLRFVLSLARFGADQFSEGKEALEEERRQADRLRTYGTLPLYHVGVGTHHLYIGEWDDAVAEFEAGVVQAERTGSRIFLVWLHATLARLAIRRDDLVVAEEALARAEAFRIENGTEYGLTSLQFAQALLCEARGECQSALSLLQTLWDFVVAGGIVWEMREIGPDLVRLACIAGANGPARMVAEALEDAAVHARTPSFEAAALRCRGLVDGDPEAFLAAAAAYRLIGRPVERAVALEEAGQALGQAGRLPEAAPLIDEAIATYEQVGAVRDAARAVATMRSLGMRRGRRGPRRRPTTGWASLTPTEQHVVRLVVEGLTNAEVGRRLFISRRTVETHLAHVFAKLGISSRRQLAKVAGDAGRRHDTA